MEHATVYMAGGVGAAERLKAATGEILASLDERPRTLAVRFRSDDGCSVSIGLERGEPVFSAEGGAPSRCACGRRWIAEHPVPLRLEDGSLLVFQPVEGGRVRVRGPSLAERICG